MQSSVAVPEPTPLDDLYAEFLEEEKPVLPPKKKKLTKAEKLERKLLAEQEFKKLEMRDQLERELKMSKMTALKYRERWEEMCREIKLKDMREELIEWENKVNRVMEQKDRKIQLILDEIASTEEMHRNDFCTQIKMMDYLTDILKVFQTNCGLLYESQVSELLNEFFREAKRSNENSNRIQVNCEGVIHATNLIVEQEMLEDYNIYLDRRDDYVNTEIEKRYRLRDSVIKKMKELRHQLLEFLDSLRNVSLDAHKYERVDALMERQRIFLLESQKLDEIESRSSMLYATLQKELAQTDVEGKRKLSDLKLEHAYFVQMRKNIENEMKLDRERTHEKLKILSSESFKILKKYQKLQKHGELLLSLAANCRKLQTESEKVVLWGDFVEPIDNDAESETIQLETINLKNHVDITEADLQKNMDLMKNFWRRQAIAEAQIVILEKTKTELLKENQNYIETIKHLSKVANVDDLKKALQVESVLEEKPFYYETHKNNKFK